MQGKTENNGLISSREAAGIAHSDRQTSPLWRSVSFVALIGLTAALAACSTSNANVRMAKQSADTDTVERRGDSSLLALASSMATEGNHAAAIPLFRQSLRRGLFGNSKASLGLGKSLMAMGQYSEAIDLLERAFDGDEHNPVVLRALGKAYLAIGRPGLAVINYEEAVATDSRHPAGYAGLGVAYDANGNHTDAVNAFDRGISSAGNHLDIVSNKGLSLVIFGDTETALELLESAVRDPSSGHAHRQNLALAYVLAGEPEKARRIASIDLDQESVADTIAYFETLRGLPPQARVTYLLYGTIEDKKDLEHNANPVIRGDETEKHQAAEHALAEPVEVAAVVTPEPEPVKPAEVNLPELPPLMDSEGWAVQIAAYRKAADVMPGWYFLKEKYADIIGQLEPRRSEVDFGERNQNPRGFFYRLNAGPLATQEEAVEICGLLDRLGGACWVRPPEPREGRLPPVAQADDEEAPMAVQQSLAAQAGAGDWVISSVEGDDTEETGEETEETEDDTDGSDDDDPSEEEILF